MPKHNFYIVRDRFGDVTNVKEVLDGNQGLVSVNVYLKDIDIQKYSAKYPASFFDDMNDPLSFSEVCPDLQTGLDLLVQSSFWFGSGVSNALMMAADRMDDGCQRFRTDSEMGRELLLSAAKRMGKTIEVILCDRPLYEWEDV